MEEAVSSQEVEPFSHQEAFPLEEEAYAFLEGESSYQEEGL